MLRGKNKILVLVFAGEIQSFGKKMNIVKWKTEKEFVEKLRIETFFWIIRKTFASYVQNQNAEPSVENHKVPQAENEG